MYREVIVGYVRDLGNGYLFMDLKHALAGKEDKWRAQGWTPCFIKVEEDGDRAAVIDPLPAMEMPLERLTVFQT